MSDSVHFSARQLKFIDWLATPKHERIPSTQEKFAEKIGVVPRTITRWKKIPELQGAVRERVRELLGGDLPDIYGALRNEAKSGSFQHIKLAMEMTGEYTPTERREFGGSVGLQIEGLEKALERVYGDDNGDQGTQ